MPKALVDTGSGPWVLSALATLGDLSPLLVVVGAAADEVVALIPPGVQVVRNPDHAEGMGSSLRAGLAAVQAADQAPDAVLVTLVDLPDVTAEVVRRLAAAATPDVLARACYRGVPGHPVLLGREHLAGVLASAVADRGARDYLSANKVRLVECGDLATGRDVDRPE